MFESAFCPAIVHERADTGKVGAGVQETELPGCRSALARPPLPGHLRTPAKNCDRRIFLNHCRGWVSISRQKIEIQRTQFRSSDRRSKSNAHNFDLPAGDRNPTRAISISRQEIKIHRTNFDSASV